MNYESRGLPDHMGNSEELAEITRRLRSTLGEIENDFTSAPINLPHRNTVRELLSTAIYLMADLGSDESKRYECCQKLDRVIEQLRK